MLPMDKGGGAIGAQLHFRPSVRIDEALSVPGDTSTIRTGAFYDSLLWELVRNHNDPP
jgi:hypothetical protein